MLELYLILNKFSHWLVLSGASQASGRARNQNQSEPNLASIMSRLSSKLRFLDAGWIAVLYILMNFWNQTRVWIHGVPKKVWTNFGCLGMYPPVKIVILFLTICLVLLYGDIYSALAVCCTWWNTFSNIATRYLDHLVNNDCYQLLAMMQRNRLAWQSQSRVVSGNRRLN